MSTPLDTVLEKTGTPVSPHVSPGLHPDILAAKAAALVGDDAPLTSHAFASARLALRTLYTAMHAFEVADLTMRKTNPNGLVVDGQNVRPEMSADDAAKLAATMGQRWNSTARVFDQHLDEVITAKATLERSIAKALENPRKNETATATAASDIRAYVKSLPDGRRMDFLHAAIEESDQEVISAVLGTSCFVSGLSRSDYAVLRDMAAKKFAGRQYEQYAALASVHEVLIRGAHIFTDRFKQLLPVLKESPSEKALAAVKGA